MKLNIALSALLVSLLTACASDSGSGGGGGDWNPAGQDEKPIESWQSEYLGQEGHGGDAVVCFNIPVSQALYQSGPASDGSHACAPGVECKVDRRSGSSGSSSSGGRPGTVWRMTPAGRKSIRSAQPLEQYMASRVSSAKATVDLLNTMTVEEGYKEVLKPFKKIPAAFSRIKATHKLLGWLKQDGYRSDYGLRDINDSGFLKESEIDTNYCAELQAVVRRDNQLWYDEAIVAHFDNAGLVLMQLHEEIYAWGKSVDRINERARPDKVAHNTSEKTRHLIVKALGGRMDSELLNENLKVSGFSFKYWANDFRRPVSLGYFMDTPTCLAEQIVFRDFVKNVRTTNFREAFHDFLSNRYVRDQSPSGENEWQLKHNFPDAIANLMELVWEYKSPTLEQDLRELERIFELPESCVGEF